jgi:cysteinyl-tRNA synthetase
MLELSDSKMSKSIGNIALLADVVDRWGADTVIAYFMQSHYRSRLPFSDDRLRDAEAACDRIRNAVRALDRALGAPEADEAANDADLMKALVDARQRFHEAMDDDFGTPGAIAAVFDLVRVINQTLDRGRPASGQLREVRLELIGLLDMLGLAGLGDPVGANAPQEVLDLLAAREAARAGRDFAAADALRDQILAHGFELRDGPDGPEVYASI